MRVLDRLTAVVAALAFVLAGLAVPGYGATPEPGTVVAAAHLTAGHPDAAPDVQTECLGGPSGDHRPGVVSTDGPDDILPAPPARLGGTLGPVVAPIRYRPPAVPLPPRRALPSRAPPAVA